MMKKLLLIILAVVITVSVSAVAQGDDVYDVFEYTDDGTVLKYYGADYVYIPPYIDETPLLKVGDRAFMDLGISSVSIGEGLTDIGESAFSGCNITDVSIPSTMSKIGDNAFAYCDALAEVFIFGNEHMEFGENVFEGTGKITFYVACQCDTAAFRAKLATAKSDGNFEIEIFHPNTTVSEETDIFGSKLLLCHQCDALVSQYDFEIYEPFDDVHEDAWYYKYVVFAYGYGIVNGKSATVFDPEGTMTCAEAAKIAASIHATQTSGMVPMSYGDKWYDAYVDYCYEVGIIEDYISFEWEKPISRCEMAYLFSRCDYYEYYINEVPLTDIPDVHDTTPYAYEILDLYNKGVATGSVGYYFNPHSNVKRSEAAAFISRIIGHEMRIELPKG